MVNLHVVLSNYKDGMTYLEWVKKNMEEYQKKNKK